MESKFNHFVPVCCKCHETFDVQAATEGLRSIRILSITPQYVEALMLGATDSPLF